ncbi:ankyrin repeat domain-containing protein [Treponema sp. OMZ 792]|uniref:ankyrin repeat domain-containing protein n=1 Tax=unclassified Treponema TaxID=2638727 RepID=UPI0020A5808A|nr:MULTISPECIES: ankyrin repeat domain-containing protein [unclassified Treponema]UTC74411.1 ankyrin repeat domain-containing protein [Treponema sp. OMZ 792]UTC80807.1 ankyrin repeat domain-containing protein [Treponema sp. OMZ 798]
MNVAIFYDEKKKDAAMAIKNIIISHECDVILYNEDEIWKDENLNTPRHIMKNITHVLFIYSKNPVAYLGFMFFSGYATGLNLPVLVLEEEKLELPKNFLRSFVMLTIKSFDAYFEVEKRRFNENLLKEQARAKLLESGYSLFIPNYVRAVKNNEKEIVSLFIDAGFDPSQKDSLGTPVLSLAVRNKCFETLELLLEKGAAINLCAEDRNYSALMDAAQVGYGEAVKVLLEKKADTNIQSKDGQTALILSVGRREADIVEMLVKHGADCNIKDGLGMSALGYAKLFGNKAILSLFGEQTN